jgi:hypothetical protein
MKVNIEKINEVCGREVYSPEDFGRTKFQWFKSQDKFDRELCEYELCLASRSVEIALLELYKLTCHLTRK